MKVGTMSTCQAHGRQRPRFLQTSAAASQMSLRWAQWQCTNPGRVTVILFGLFIYLFLSLWLKQNSLRTSRASLLHTMYSEEPPPFCAGWALSLHQNTFDHRGCPGVTEAQLTCGLCEDHPASVTHPRAFKWNFLCKVQQNLQGHAHGKSENGEDNDPSSPVHHLETSFHNFPENLSSPLLLDPGPRPRRWGRWSLHCLLHGLSFSGPCRQRLL